MSEMEKLKEELRKLKAEEQASIDVAKVKTEIRQLKAKKKSFEFRKKHPVMTGIARLSIAGGKTMTKKIGGTPEQQKQAKAKLKELLKF